MYVLDFSYTYPSPYMPKALTKHHNNKGQEIHFEVPMPHKENAKMKKEYLVRWEKHSDTEFPSLSGERLFPFLIEFWCNQNSASFLAKATA